jgi:LPXTG-site transpeptidase (sortase) family protein
MNARHHGRTGLWVVRRIILSLIAVAIVVALVGIVINLRTAQRQSADNAASAVIFAAEQCKSGNTRYCTPDTTPLLPVELSPVYQAVVGSTSAATTTAAGTAGTTTTTVALSTAAKTTAVPTTPVPTTAGTVTTTTMVWPPAGLDVARDQCQLRGLADNSLPSMSSPAQGNITILSIGMVETNWFEGDCGDWVTPPGNFLDRGPVHFPQTAWPGEGGIIHIAAHRTHAGGVFGHLAELQIGQTITVSLRGTVYTYTVTSQKYGLSPDAMSALRGQGRNQGEVLMLSTCEGKGDTRSVVLATLSQSAPA